MPTPRDQLAGRMRLPRHRRRLIMRLVMAGLALLVLLQVATIAVLTVVDRQRRRRHPPAHFPHHELPAIAERDNAFEVFTYGRDLYDAMLAAIDSAQDTIYIETYIWKDDAAGAAFKEHLIRKAAEGVQVYAIFDVFGNLVVSRAFKAFPPAIHTLKYRGIRRPRHLL